VKVSDAIAQFLAEQGIKYVFTISGGADLHIIDSIKKRTDINIFCPQNEQCGGFEADAYARARNGLGCALVTSGPGATNLVTCIATSYYDSIPVLYLTGNQTRDRCERYGTRQYGFQATPIVSMVREITKMSVQIVDPALVWFTLSEAVKEALRPRRGPVVVDIPDDIQRMTI
jgi:acetolactate synthase-1/2/3 large subunit